MENTLLIALILGIPSLVIITCWVSLLITMRKTTGELKLFLSPKNMVRLFAIYLVLAATTLLGALKIIEGSVVGVIFSGVIGYTIGSNLNQKQQ